MAYLAGSQTTTIQASFGSGFPQSQQLPWTYKYGEDRTAVTYPSKVIESVPESIISHVYETDGYDSQWKYWILTHSSYQALQDLAKITSIWIEKSISATFISEAQ